MDYGSMLETIRKWLSDLIGKPVQVGIPETSPGISMQINAAGVLDTYYSRNERRDVTLTIYVKDGSQMACVSLCDAIGRLMTRATSYPKGEGWVVLTMQAGGALPVEQEESTKLWLYVNNVELTYLS